jgi:hypothetical protein
MAAHLDQDPAYQALSRALYWAQEVGARPEVGTRDVREHMLEFASQMRTDERLLIPLGEPNLYSPTPWKRKLKYAIFRVFRPISWRYDRLLADQTDLSIRLAERVIELESEVDQLRERLERQTPRKEPG